MVWIVVGNFVKMYGMMFYLFYFYCIVLYYEEVERCLLVRKLKCLGYWGFFVE